MENVIIKKGCEADDLLRCCEKISVLGTVVSDIGFKRDAVEFFHQGYGEHLGDVISDYANVLKSYLEGAYLALERHFESQNKEETSAKEVS